MLRFILSLLFLISFDFTISQLFLLDILYKKKIEIFKSDIENRVPNSEYKYTFKKNAEFIARYDYKYSLKDYSISTNNLGFRDKEVRMLNEDKNYSIIIGDSFVEGVALEYDDTITAILNKQLSSNEFENFEFLNAGVSSYSPYLYKKKIEDILKKNEWLKVKSVVILYDKSDIADNTAFYDKPKTFSLENKIFKNRKRDKLFTDLSKLRFVTIFTEQTITGIFLREVVVESAENFLRFLKFYIKSIKLYNSNFYTVSKAQINSLYASDFHRLQSFLYDPKWETDSKKSINFAFENFMDLKEFLHKRGISMVVVLYPWPFELLDEQARNRYLHHLKSKFSEKDIDNLVIYDKFLEGDKAENILKFYIPKDVHFNKKGNEVLSDKIFKKVYKNN